MPLFVPFVSPFSSALACTASVLSMLAGAVSSAFVDVLSFLAWFFFRFWSPSSLVCSNLSMSSLGSSDFSLGRSSMGTKSSNDGATASVAGSSAAATAWLAALGLRPRFFLGAGSAGTASTGTSAAVSVAGSVSAAASCFAFLEPGFRPRLLFSATGFSATGFSAADAASVASTAMGASASSLLFWVFCAGFDFVCGTSSCFLPLSLSAVYILLMVPVLLMRWRCFLSSFVLSSVAFFCAPLMACASRIW